MVDSWNSLTAEEAGKVISTTGNCPKGDEERAAWIQRGLDKGREMMAAQVIAPEDEETLAEHIAETASEESPEEPSVDADDIEDADVVERGEGGTEASDSE
jgi:siroheme synthase (precorrin-2 oxidase/ferrochelatase)